MDSFSQRHRPIPSTQKRLIHLVQLLIRPDERPLRLIPIRSTQRVRRRFGHAFVADETAFSRKEATTTESTVLNAGTDVYCGSEISSHERSERS